MAPADDLELHPDLRPQPVRQISDPDTLRALGDPTRIRILETMVQRPDAPWSVKDLAAALGLPQTRLYHHVDQLLAHDLIRAVERRVVSGIIETRYRVTALSFQLDRRMFAAEAGDETRTILHDTLAAVFDTARDEVEDALRHGAAAKLPDGEDRMLVSRGLARLTPERAAELRQRLIALQAEFDTNDAGADAETWGIVVAVYPVMPPNPGTDPDTDPETATEPTDA
jgi:DNA-binding transcriptional ArsR family regulator